MSLNNPDMFYNQFMDAAKVPPYLPYGTLPSNTQLKRYPHYITYVAPRKRIPKICKRLVRKNPYVGWFVPNFDPQYKSLPWWGPCLDLYRFDFGNYYCHSVSVPPVTIFPEYQNIRTIQDLKQFLDYDPRAKKKDRWTEEITYARDKNPHHLPLFMPIVHTCWDLNVYEGHQCVYGQEYRWFIHPSNGQIYQYIDKKSRTDQFKGKSIEYVARSLGEFMSRMYIETVIFFNLQRFEFHDERPSISLNNVNMKELIHSAEQSGASYYAIKNKQKHIIYQIYDENPTLYDNYITYHSKNWQKYLNS